MAQDIFIQSKKAFHFHDQHNDLIIPAEYVGKLPEWATHTGLFGLATKGGDITYVGEPPKTILTGSTPAGNDVSSGSTPKDNAKGTAK